VKKLGKKQKKRKKVEKSEKKRKNGLEFRFALKQKLLNRKKVEK
jgi:hypothetical protein